jgi:hypothetical protein
MGEAQMREYPVDIPADVLVPWLRQDMELGLLQFAVRATREYLVEDAPSEQRTNGLDLSEMAVATVVGTLEMEPPGMEEPWVLQVQVQDSLTGDRLPDDEVMIDEPEEVDLTDFESQFLTPDGPPARVTVAVETAAAKQDFDRFLRRLVERHRAPAT